MPSGAKANDQNQYKLSTAEQIEKKKKKRELLGLFLRWFEQARIHLRNICFSW